MGIIKNPTIPIAVYIKYIFPLSKEKQNNNKEAVENIINTLINCVLTLVNFQMNAASDA